MTTVKHTRAWELIEGPDGKLSSTKVCTYIAVLTLCAVLLITATTQDVVLDVDGKKTVKHSAPSSEIALIMAGLALGTLITNRTADVKIMQAQNPAPAPSITNVNQPGIANVAPAGGDDAA